MREQGIELIADVAIGPLCVALPARDRLEPGRALESHGFREAAVDDQRRLVDLQRDCHAGGVGHQILLASERGVEHPDEELHQNGGVARSHRPQGALDDEHLFGRDDAVEVDEQRIVEQYALDRRRVEQSCELVDRGVELRGRHAARVCQLGGQLGGEKRRDLLVLRQRTNARGDRAAIRIALLADRQKPCSVPKRRAAVICEHSDDRVAQVAV